MVTVETAAGFSVAVTALSAFGVAAFRVVARVTRVHDVILGTDELPGISKRMEAVERRTLQLEPNHGTHLYDTVTATSKGLTDLVGEFRAADRRAAVHEGEQNARLNAMQHDVSNVRATMTLLGQLVDRLHERDKATKLKDTE